MNTAGELVLLLMFCMLSYCTSDTCGRCYCRHDERRGCVVADCVGRRLRSIPPNLPFNTCQLLLQENDITCISENDLKNLSHLLLLDLSHNDISEVKNGSFEVPIKLRNLDISSNRISFRNTPLDVLTPLQDLEVLDLSNNTYEEYPVSFLQQLRALKRLKMDGISATLGEGFKHLKNLSLLSLSGLYGRCQIPTVTHDLFQYVTNLLTFLDISYCNISLIEPGALYQFQDIKTLNLSGNIYLGFKGFENATYGLNSSKLETLMINGIIEPSAICVQVTAKHVQHLTGTNLTLLEANDNRIEVFDESVFRLLPPTLKNVSVRSSRFTAWPYLWRLHDLKGIVNLDLSGKPGRRKVPFADDLNASRTHVVINQCHVPERRVAIAASTGWSIHKSPPAPNRSKQLFHLPPDLTHFKYTNAELAYTLSEIHFAQNNLRYINVSKNVFTDWIGPIFGLENLTNLDLSANTAKHIDPCFFHTFPSLVFLNVSHNFLEATLYSDANGTHFAKLEKLEFLDLSMNSIQQLHKRILKGLKSLKVLNVSRNNIYWWSCYLRENANLSHIDLSYNDIKYIGIHGRSQMTWLANKHQFSIDLSHNELRCACEELGFFDWLLNSNIIAANLHSYYCRDVDMKIHHYPQFVKVINRLKVSCRTYMALSMGALSVVVLTTTLVVCAVGYRYRWKLRFWYYTVVRPPRPRPDNTYEFDVFVAYADSEEDFACTEMLSILEIERGLKLYLRDRDSLAGNDISYNIIDGIRASRKTVICMTKSFLKSKWCNYELHMSYLEGLHRKRTNVIVVFLEHVRNKDIPVEMLRDATNITVLEYPHWEENLSEFWECLTAYIRS